MDIMEPYLGRKKVPYDLIMKSDKTIIRKNHMEQLHFITKLLDIKDPNIKILDIINKDTHKEIIAKLDYDAPC
ncbi:IS1167 transposase [Streptococcus pneumoniae]|nr:IS1167 transposase [Streptococcus pneumoniae]